MHITDTKLKLPKRISQQVPGQVTFLCDASGPKHLNLTLTQAKFEELVSDLVERTVQPCLQAIDDAGLSKTEIDDVTKHDVIKHG